MQYKPQRSEHAFSFLAHCIRYGGTDVKCTIRNKQYVATDVVPCQNAAVVADYDTVYLKQGKYIWVMK